MGLYMKPLSSVILLFLTSVATVTVLVFGCSDELREEKGELGPEVDGNLVIEAIDKARGSRNILELQETNAVHFETNQKVEMGGPQVVLDEIYSVFHRAETEETIKIVMTKTEITYPDGMDGEPSVRKVEMDPIYIPKSSPQGNVTPQNSDKPTPFYSAKEVNAITQGKLLSVSSKDENNRKLTFHNFKIAKFKKAPPHNVREAKNCLGIPDCLLEVTQINFDLVEWDGDDWQKTNFEMLLTADANFLATDLYICQGAFLFSEPAKRDFYVRQCRIVRDFKQ